MRIIGGDLKGRLIEPPSGFRARPTTDFARESLMNILNNRIDFESVSLLDLFSGTGAISYEFASRGTTDIDLVESDSRHALFITRTLSTLGIKTARVHRTDTRGWLKKCSRQYSIIFADPPYDLPWLDELPDMVFSSGAVSSETVFILEHPMRKDFSSHRLFSEHRRYGNVNFSFFMQQFGK